MDMDAFRRSRSVVSVDFESGINTAIYASLIGSLSNLFVLSARGGEMLLAVIIVTKGSAVLFALAGIRANRSSRWLFWLGVLSWAGVFVGGSWQINEAIKITSSTFFLMCFVEATTYSLVAGHAENSRAGI